MGKSSPIRRPKVEDLIAIIDEKKGNLSAVARSLGVSRQAVYNWVQSSVKVQEALESARETMIDNAESVLYRKVIEGSTPELLFFLKTQAKHRGYVEREERTGANGEPIQVVLDV